jgi:hypothetical protein
MRKLTYTSLATLGLATAAAQVRAVPVVNGSLDAEYGAPITVQTNATGFGDSNLGQVGYANGSELDAGYGVISGGRLYLFFAGNLETNFNKLNVFIDSGAAGGQNQLVALGTDQGNFNRMAGMTFDTGFNATNWIAMTGGGATPDIFIDYANLVTGVGNYSGTTTPTNGALSGGNGGPVIQATWNNSNTTGVTGSTAPNNAALVSTGMEFSIALADIGWTGGDIRVAAFINGSGQDYASNQFLGGLAFGTGNLGGDGNGNFTGNLAGINLNNFAGAQYFVVPIPEPTTFGALGIGVLTLLRRRAAR